MSSISCLYGHEPLGSKEPYMLYNEQMQNLPESIKKVIMNSWNHKKEISVCSHKPKPSWEKGEKIRETNILMPMMI